MANITLKQGEAKTITVTITDDAGDAVNVSSATLSFKMVATAGTGGNTVTKDDNDFDKTDAGTGIVTFILTSSDTASVATYKGDIKIYFSATNIDITEDINIKIKDSVIV